MMPASVPSGVYGALARSIAGSPPMRRDDAGWLERLAREVDPAESRPELASDIEVKEFRLRWGNDYAMIANPRELLHFRLEPGEVDLLALMDGEHTVKEILVERFRESGDLELSALADLVQQLRAGGFLEDRYVDVQAAVRRAMDPVPTWRRKARGFVKTLSIDWRGAHRMVAWFYRWGLRWFFVPWIAVVAGLVSVVGFVAFLSLVGSGRFSLSGADAAVT